MISVGMSMQMQGPKAAQQAAAAPKFKQLLDDLEKSTIPSRFSTPAREAAKKDLVAALRKVADGGPDEELKAQWEKARESMKTLGAP
jgi:hypothetical protein